MEWTWTAGWLPRRAFSGWYRESKLRLSAYSGSWRRDAFGGSPAVSPNRRMCYRAGLFFLDDFSDQVLEEVPLAPAEFLKYPLSIPDDSRIIVLEVIEMEFG